MSSSNKRSTTEVIRKSVYRERTVPASREIPSITRNGTKEPQFDLADKFMAQNPTIYSELTPEGGLSNSFIGNSSANWGQSMNSHSGFESNKTSWEISDSSNHFISNKTFSSSSDILRYLQSHPNFQHLPKDMLSVIAAGILSGLVLIVGGVLIVYSWGTATPEVVLGVQTILATVLFPSVVSSVGFSGLLYTVQHIDNFEWGEFGTACAIAGGMTILTFGVGYGAGHLSGVAIAGTRFASSTLGLKIVSMAAGAIASATTRIGVNIVISLINDQVITVVKLIIDGVVGAYSGAKAGLLAVRQFMLTTMSRVGTEGVATPTATDGSTFVLTPDVSPSSVISLSNIPVEGVNNISRATSFVDSLLRVSNSNNSSGIGLSQHSSFASILSNETGVLQQEILEHPEFLSQIGYSELGLKLSTMSFTSRAAAVITIPPSDLNQIASTLETSVRKMTKYGVHLPSHSIYFPFTDETNTAHVKIVLSGHSYNGVQQDLMTVHLGNETLPTNEISWIQRVM
jgi:hypothetical protein